MTDTTIEPESGEVERDTLIKMGDLMYMKATKETQADPAYIRSMEEAMPAMNRLETLDVEKVKKARDIIGNVPLGDHSSYQLITSMQAAVTLLDMIIESSPVPVSINFAVLAHAANHISGYAEHDIGCSSQSPASHDICDCGYRDAIKTLQKILQEAESTQEQESI